MNLIWAAGGAVAGLPGGAALRGTVFRLSVPTGSPDRTACPRCVAPIGGWLAGRCGHCGVTLGVPATLELATAAVLGLLLGQLGGQPDVAAFCFLGVLGVALSAIDITVQRLPDRLVLPAYPLLIALLSVAALVRHDPATFYRALLGGLALALSYLILALLSRGQLGGGDVKLAGLTGLALGWLSWPALLAGAMLAFALFGLTSLVLLAARRITMRSHISFGPFMLGGALVAILVSGR